MLVAKEKGWFAEKNLDVEYVRGQGASAVAPLVASGERDMAQMSSPAVVLGAARDYPVTIVGVASTVSPIYLIADEDIKQPTDLYGKRMGVQIEQFEGAVWKAFVAAAGLDESKIEVVPTKPGQYVLFIDGRLDALVTFYLDVSTVEILDKHPGKETVLPLQKWVPTYGHVVIANDTFRKEHPDAVRGFLDVWARATAYTVAHQDEALGLLRDKCPELTPKASKFAIDIYVQIWRTAYHREHGVLSFDGEGVERTKEVLVKGGLMDDADISDHYTQEYLPDPPVRFGQ